MTSRACPPGQVGSCGVTAGSPGLSVGGPHTENRASATLPSLSNTSRSLSTCAASPEMRDISIAMSVTTCRCSRGLMRAQGAYQGPRTAARPIPCQSPSTVHRPLAPQPATCGPSQTCSGTKPAASGSETARKRREPRPGACIPLKRSTDTFHDPQPKGRLSEQRAGLGPTGTCDALRAKPHTCRHRHGLAPRRCQGRHAGVQNRAVIQARFGASGPELRIS